MAWNRGDGPRDGFYTDDSDNGVFFLRVNNLKENSIDLTDVKLITRNVHEKTLRRSQVTAGDLVFAISGTKDNLGTVSIVPDFIKEANLNSALIRLDLDWSRLDKKYFCLLFSLGFIRIQIDYIGKGAAQNNLNNEEISQIQIPVPPLEIQSEIVKLFDAAYAARRAKEAKAKAMLDRIDAYLLEQLSIESSVKTEAGKTFFIQAFNLSGGRFDPNFYKPNFQALVNTLKDQPHKRLREIVKFSSESWNQKDFFENTFPYIEISEIDIDKGEISNVSNVKISEAPSRAKMIVRNGDIIISTTRPNRGAIAKITEKENFSIASTGFAVIRNADGNSVMKDYLHSVLRHRICLLQMEQRSSGGNYPAITQEELGNILIPLPHLSVQTKVATNIQAIKEQAKQLEEDAKAEIEKAKAEVEKMILGEVGLS